MASNNTFSLRTFDGLKLFGKSWPVQNPRAAVLLLHGMGEHILRYEHVAAFFNMQGIAMLGFDHRGHGQSEGKRGHTPGLGALLNDIETGQEEMTRLFPDCPDFIYGHSFGGNLALSYCLDRRPSIQGTIASAPWIQLAFNPPKYKVMLGNILSGILPSLSQHNELDVNYLSRDTEVVKKYVEDPLVHDRITLAMGTTMLNQADVLNSWKGEFPVPLLLLHGTADQLTSPAATEAFFQRNRQSNEDMKLKLYRDFYHEIHNEPQQISELQDIVAWIESHI